MPNNSFKIRCVVVLFLFGSCAGTAGSTLAATKQKFECQETQAACSSAKAAYNAAKACVEWVRRGTYKDDGARMRYDDCDPKPEELKPTMTEKCGQHHVCARRMKCDTIIANATIEGPTCVYAGSPGTFRCDSGPECPEILIAGIRFPEDPAAASDLSLRCTHFDGIENAITRIRLGYEDVQFMNPEEGVCPDDPIACESLREQFMKCMKTSLKAVRVERDFCECQAGYDPARPPPGPRVRECPRKTPKSRDAGARATADMVGFITGTDKLACRLWTPTDVQLSPP